MSNEQIKRRLEALEAQGGGSEHPRVLCVENVDGTLSEPGTGRPMTPSELNGNDVVRVVLVSPPKPLILAKGMYPH